MVLNNMKKLIIRNVFIAVLALLSPALTVAQSANTGYTVGEIVPDFALKNVDGKIVKLSDNKKAKGFILIFSSNSCIFSQAYEQRVINLHKKYAPLGYPVISINPNDVTREPEDSYENMQAVAKAKKYPFAYVKDNTQEIAKAFGATRTPHVFILQKTTSGNKLVYIGAIDNNYEDANAATEKYVENAVNSLLKGKPIAKTSTKAIGCAIKWKK